MSLDLDLYFQKLKLKSSTLANESFLFDIQKAQLTTLPFENIDSLHHLPVAIDESHLENKLLKNDRGGYCFELNLLLQAALKQCGFHVRSLLSRVMYRGTGVNARTHILLLVEIGDKKYIADAGFGGPGFFSPMPFELSREDLQENGIFRLIKDPDFGFILQKKNTEMSSGWHNIYTFNLDLVYPPDLEMSNHYTSTFSQSHFRENLIISFFKKDQTRLSLLNRTLSHHSFTGALIERREIITLPLLLETLKEDFNIVLAPNLSFQKLFDNDSKIRK